MEEQGAQRGLDDNQLFAIGLLAAILDSLAWLRFVMLLDGPDSLNPSLAAWFAGAMIGLVVSAVYFVVSYLKTTERRLQALAKQSAGSCRELT